MNLDFGGEIIHEAFKESVLHIIRGARATFFSDNITS